MENFLKKHKKNLIGSAFCTLLSFIFYKLAMTPQENEALVLVFAPMSVIFGLVSINVLFKTKIF